MKAFLLPAILLLAISAPAQYYYKDIVGTKETAANMRAYFKNNVTRVVLTSYDENDTKIPGFLIEQAFFKAENKLRTTTTTGNSSSVLISYVDANGNVTKTTDSSARFFGETQYVFNPAGELVNVSSFSTDSAKTTTQTEVHYWQYENGRIKSLLRIKNKVDTTRVTFVYDENGNVAEEHTTHKGIQLEPYYYYYDEQNRLTDVVRFNPLAKRLLPEYLLEYDADGRVIQRITVPSNNDAYLIWRYLYNSQGLLTKEAIFNKQKQLTGKVVYQYFFDR